MLQGQGAVGKGRPGLWEGISGTRVLLTTLQSEERPSELQDTIYRNKLGIIGVPEGEKTEKVSESHFKI